MSDKHKTEHDTVVDTKLVKQLAKMLAETQLTEIEVEKGDMRIRVAREVFTSPAPYSVAVPSAPVAQPMPVAVSAPAAHSGSKDIAGAVLGIDVADEFAVHIHLADAGITKRIIAARHRRHLALETPR